MRQLLCVCGSFNGSKNSKKADLDRTCEHYTWAPLTNSSTPSKEMKDIFDGEILRNFKGFDGQLFTTSGEEGRYVFSLCVDYFNLLGNKQAGKKKSIGLISLVCLNLPPDMRYKPENMFLFGIIPGPSEPLLTSLNHYLCPLVVMLRLGPEPWSRAMPSAG